MSHKWNPPHPTVQDPTEQKNLDSLVQYLDGVTPGGGGGAGGQLPYAVQVKRHTGTNKSIVSGADTPIDFTSVYFENNGGVLFPADGGVWPPAPSASMFTSASDLLLTAPVEGLWGFRAEYTYTAMPLGTYVRTRVDHNNSTVAWQEHAREASYPGSTFLEASIEGTVWMSAGDYLKVWTMQFSGANQTITDSSTINNDEPGSGPVFAMWLIAPRTASTGGSGGSGFTPTAAQFVAGSGPLLAPTGSTPTFYADWTLNTKTPGSAYNTQAAFVGGVVVQYIVPDGPGLYLIRWDGYVTLTNAPVVGDATLVRIARLPIGGVGAGPDFRSDSYIEFGNPANHVTAQGLLEIDTTAGQVIAVFLDDEANTGKPSAVSASANHWLDIVKVGTFS